MSGVPYEMFFHPELLTNDQLLDVIHERHLKIPNLELMSRDLLLEVFHNYCVPYAQRRKDCGRGKNANKTRKMDTTTPLSKVDVVHSHQNNLIRIRNDNMKPPPDLLSGHLKRIKLNTEFEKIVFCSHNENATNKRKNSEMEIGSPPAKKERKPITWP